MYRKCSSLSVANYTLKFVQRLYIIVYIFRVHQVQLEKVEEKGSLGLKVKRSVVITLLAVYILFLYTLMIYSTENRYFQRAMMVLKARRDQQDLQAHQAPQD